MQLSFTQFNYLQLYPIAKSISEISNVGVNQMSKHFM